MIKFDKEEKKEIYASVNYLVRQFKAEYDGYDPDIIPHLDNLLIKITDWIVEED